jgi:predicted RecA/RadA family phage recombinase
MKNYVQTGINLTLPAPYDLTSGDGALIGAIFGVAAETVEEGADVDLVVAGVFALPKPEVDLFSVGDAVYWDDDAKLVTVVGTDNTRIGVAVAASAGATVNVRLNGSF